MTCVGLIVGCTQAPAGTVPNVQRARFNASVSVDQVRDRITFAKSKPARAA